MGFWEPLFFWIFALGAVVTSGFVIWARNPLYCALALIADFFFFAGLYVLLSAHFLAVVQVLVYGGAIMVLFLFIIMLLNLRDHELVDNRFQLHYVVAIASGVALFFFSTGAILATVDFDEVDEQREQYAQMVEEADEDETVMLRTASQVPGLYADANEAAVVESYEDHLRAIRDGQANPADGKYPAFDPERDYELPPSLNPDPAESEAVPGRQGLYGTFKPVSILLVNRFVIPFELTAVLLLAAIVGAVIIAKRRVS